eukprot:177850_1
MIPAEHNLAYFVLYSTMKATKSQLYSLEMYDCQSDPENKGDQTDEELKQIADFFQYLRVVSCYGWKPETFVVGLNKLELIQITCSPLPRNFSERRVEFENQLRYIKPILRKRYDEYQKETIDSSNPHFNESSGVVIECRNLICVCQQFGLYALAMEMVSLFTTLHPILRFMLHTIIVESNISLGKSYSNMVRSKQAYVLLPFSKCNKYNVYVHKHVISAFVMLYKNRKTESDKINLGFVMMFASKLIHQWIQNTTISMINYGFGKTKEHKGHTSLAKVMKTWTVKYIKQKGQKLYLKSCVEKCIKKKNGSDFDQMLTEIQLDPNECYIRGQYERIINKDYDRAKEYFVSEIICQRPHMIQNYHMIDRVVGLIGLSKSCHQNEEYIMSKKSLNAAYKLCGKYFMSGFVQMDYNRYTKSLKRTITLLKCDNCSRSNNDIHIRIRYKCCTGCMRVFYCTRKCQKIHWSLHKNRCNKTWKWLYPAIKYCIFDALNSK